MSTRTFSDYPIGSPEYNAEFCGNKTTAVAIVFMVLIIILTGMRFASRYLNRTKYGWDDFWIIPSLVFCVGTCVVSIVMVAIGGVGRHAPALAQSNPVAIVNWAKALVAVEALYLPAVVFPKLSVLASYLRIFTVKWHRILCYIVGGIISANAVAAIITSLVSCRPLAARWDPTIPNAKCIPIDPFWRWGTFANIVTDVIMFGLPLPTIWGLQVSMKQKLGLSLVFLTGSAGLVSSIIRFAIFFDTEGFIDGTWTSAVLMIWTVIEPGIYHIAACLLTLRPLFLFLFRGISTKMSRRHTELDDKTALSSKQIQLSGLKGLDSRNGAGFIRMDVSFDVSEDS